MENELVIDKGEYKGSCNRTSCQAPNSAFWFNHSTEKYYCAECADLINNANRADAYRLFGHELCTIEVEKDNTKTYFIRPCDVVPDIAMGYAMATKKERENAHRTFRVRTEPKIKRNWGCPCGSQKKYKKCCFKG